MASSAKFVKEFELVQWADMICICASVSRICAITFACAIAHSIAFADQPNLYSYDNANHLVQATSATGNGVQFVSDANGNSVSASAISEIGLSVGNGQSVQITTPGANAVFDFTVSANGHPLAVSLGSIVTSPSGSPETVGVYDSGGSLVASGTVTGSGAVNLPTLSAGTYTVVVAPQRAATGTMQVTLVDLSANASSGDVPLPLWTYAMLGALLLWVMRRAGSAPRPVGG